MCGRYSWKKPNAKRFAKLTSEAPAAGQSLTNRAPGQIHPTLSAGKESNSWNEMWWGRPPRETKPSPINARCETVSEKPSFRDSFEQRRCLVPADGFYEWQVLETEKYPHFIHLPEQATFAMAGIWRRSTIGSEEKDVFTILTQSAHPALLHIHHRMPVILEESDWETWITPSSPLSSLLGILAKPGPEMRAFQVSKKVNSTKHDGDDLQEPFGERQSTLF